MVSVELGGTAEIAEHAEKVEGMIQVESRIAHREIQMTRREEPKLLWWLVLQLVFLLAVFALWLSTDIRTAL